MYPSATLDAEGMVKDKLHITQWIEGAKKLGYTNAAEEREKIIALARELGRRIIARELSAED